MAFYITKNGQPNIILTDGGSIEVGENLSVDENGKLNAQAGTEVYVDDELSLESENPVQNKVITKTIEDVEQVTAAALNDLNDKKANRDELAQVAFTGDYNDLSNRPGGNYVENKAGSASPYTTIIDAANATEMQNSAQLKIVQLNASLSKQGNILTVGGEDGISVEISERTFPNAKFTYNGNEVTTKADFKTINGESIIGSGNIVIQGGGSDFDASRIKAGDYIILTYLDENEQEVQSPQDAYYVKIDANIPAMEETISQWERVVANALARHEQAIQELQNA